MTNSTEKSNDNLVYLIGRPPIQEFLGYVKIKTIGGQSTDLGALASEWRTANNRIHELESIESGIANDATIMEIDDKLESLKSSVLENPFFKKSFALIPSTIGVVELDKLVVFQKHINLSYTDMLTKSLGSSPTDEDIFKFCMPLERTLPPVSINQIAGNVYVFNSPSTDFRFQEPIMIDANQITGYSPSSPVSAVVGLMLGFGPNFLNVVQMENRLILNNGSHRAYALRSLGITHAPCIIQHVTRREELEFLHQDIQQNPDLYLKTSRPPLLKDYFDPMLRKILTVPKMSRQVKISFGVETSDIPYN